MTREESFRLEPWEVGVDTVRIMEDMIVRLNETTMSEESLSAGESSESSDAEPKVNPEEDFDPELAAVGEPGDKGLELFATNAKAPVGFAC